MSGEGGEGAGSRVRAGSPRAGKLIASVCFFRRCRTSCKVEKCAFLSRPAIESHTSSSAEGYPIDEETASVAEDVSGETSSEGTSRI